MARESNLLSILFLLLIASALFSQTIFEDRGYEPVVMRRSILTPYFGIPVKEIFMYAYHANSQSWELIPFQIDEVTKGPDPLNPSDSLLFYFVPDEWNRPGHDGVLSTHDELVFLIRDLGDKAPVGAWIDNSESKNNPRLEIVIEDKFRPGSLAYGYLYRSSTITEPVPTPYDLESFPDSDSLSSKFYAIDFAKTGLLEDIILKEPGGNGKDIFDTQKLRFSGVLDLGIGPVDLFLTEKNLYLYPEKKFTPHPVVRIVRQAKMTLQLGSFISHNTPFWVRTRFYPYSGQFEGGASIAKDALKEFWPGSDAVVIMHDLRQSWDFNQNAVGMTFYNKKNNAIPVDGVPDNLNRAIDVPITEWNLLTGDPGTFITFTQFYEQNWHDILLYYWDSQQGGQFDQFIFTDIFDTGDNQSYGDHGILFRNYDKDDITLALNFLIYFIPEKNIDQDRVQLFADNLLNPVTPTVITHVDDARNQRIPAELTLYQNNPNPARTVTQIRFYLPKRERAEIRILDLNGRLVKTLGDRQFSVGEHRIQWDGKNDKNETVSAGIYFIVVKTPTALKTKKLTVLK